MFVIIVGKFLNCKWKFLCLDFGRDVWMDLGNVWKCVYMVVIVELINFRYIYKFFFSLLLKVGRLVVLYNRGEGGLYIKRNIVFKIKVK